MSWINNLGETYTFDKFNYKTTLEVGTDEPATDVKSAAATGKMAAALGSSTAMAATGTVTVAAALGGSAAAPFIRFIQILKIFNRLRYININFGNILGGFLGAISEMHSDDIASKPDLVKYEDGIHGKLSKFEVSLLVLDKTSWKLGLYLLSYSLKLLSGCLIRRMR